MKADPSRQWRLLDLARLDTRSGQLAHKRKTLPQDRAYSEIAARLATHDDDLVRARTAASDVQREVDRAESAVQLVRDRAARNQARLDAGQGSAKDLQALQHELASLDRRQAELEDAQLEVMERVEALEADVERLTAEQQALTEQVEEAAQARDAALAAIAAEEAPQEIEPALSEQVLAEPALPEPVLPEQVLAEPEQPELEQTEPDQSAHGQSTLGQIGIERAAEKVVSSGAARAIFVSPEGDEAAASSVLVAREIADAGLRVLLLDLTASGAASIPMLESSRLQGITDLLASEAQFGEVIHGDRYSDCHVIPTGTADPVRAMRAADRLPIIMQSLTTAYDVVVVECGPTDAEGLGRLVGERTQVFVSVVEADDAVAEAAVELIRGGYADLTLVTPVGYDTPKTPVPGRSAA